MAYIGRQLVRGQNRVLDDISGSFNGSTTAFNLTVSSSSSPPASVNQLWIILGGILQKPGTDFTVADAVITFTTAPASTLSFWGMIQGDTSDINAPSDASVTPSKIANSGDFAFPADVRFKDADGSHYVGLQAPSTVSTNLVWTLPAADGSANQLLKTDGSGALGWASDTQSNLLDEDNMSSNSATQPASQQSIKAYADTKAALTGSTNNTITTVTGANAIQGEANLTFDGSILTATQSNSAKGMLLKNSAHDSILEIYAEAANKNSVIWFGDAADDDIGYIDYDHNDNSLTFATNTAQAIRIVNNKNVIIGDGTTSTTFLDVRRADNTVYSATSNTVNGIKVFNDSNVDGGFASIELAATDAQDYYGSTLLKSIADGENYANDFVIQTRHGGNYAERLRITSEGYKTTPNQPCCMYTGLSNSHTNNATDSTETLVFATAKRNEGSHYNGSNGRFTAPVAGTYFVGVNLLIDDNATTASRSADLQKNGSGYCTLTYDRNGGIYTGMSGTGIIELAVGDYISIRATSGVHIGNETGLVVYLLG